jgi:hypothetical protein
VFADPRERSARVELASGRSGRPELDADDLGIGAIRRVEVERQRPLP